jgi:hypothetical protein
MTFRTDAVLLIQSLKEIDAETGRLVRDHLIEGAVIQSDRVRLFNVFDDKDFTGSLAWILNQIKCGDIKYPCIQIDCHGSPEGLCLRSGDIVIWSRVQDFMNQILSATENNLLVVLGSCYGGFLFQKEHLKFVPCSVLVASHEIINGDSLSERLGAFYETLFATGKSSKAMESLNDLKFSAHGQFDLVVPIL